MSIKVTKIQELQTEMRALQARLDNLRLPSLELSQVYAEGMVYGLVYKDGHGNIEALSVMDNQPERLIETAKKTAKTHLDERLYVVGFKPESIYAIIEGAKLPTMFTKST